MGQVQLQAYENIQQRTLKDSFCFIGNGKHSAIRVVMNVLPAGPNTGIRFIRRDVNSICNEIILNSDNVKTVHGCSTVTNNVGIRVTSVDQLLAAFKIHGIDNATIVLDGPEIPEEQALTINASGQSFFQIIEKAGTKVQCAFRR